MKKKRKDPILIFEYVNWKGERAIRKVKPITIWYGETDFHKGKQWFLKALDLDKNAERDFALKDVIRNFHKT